MNVISAEEMSLKCSLWATKWQDTATGEAKRLSQLHTAPFWEEKEITEMHPIAGCNYLLL